MNIVGRNDRCPCGSGKKFKKCCLPSASEDAIARMSSAERLKERVQMRDVRLGDGDSLFIQDPKGIRKMSEIILEFARPLLDEANSFEAYKKVILVAMLAWNLSLTDESEANAKLETLCNDLVRSMDDDMVVEFRHKLTKLIQRKREHFPQVKRMVMDWDLVKMNNSFHLNVVSTLIDGDVDVKQFEKEVGRLVESNRSAYA